MGQQGEGLKRRRINEKEEEKMLACVLDPQAPENRERERELIETLVKDRGRERRE